MHMCTRTHAHTHTHTHTHTHLLGHKWFEETVHDFEEGEGDVSVSSRNNLSKILPQKLDGGLEGR